MAKSIKVPAPLRQIAMYDDGRSIEFDTLTNLPLREFECTGDYVGICNAQFREEYERECQIFIENVKDQFLEYLRKPAISLLGKSQLPNAEDWPLIAFSLLVKLEKIDIDSPKIPDVLAARMRSSDHDQRDRVIEFYTRGKSKDPDVPDGLGKTEVEASRLAHKYLEKIFKAQKRALADLPAAESLRSQFSARKKSKLPLTQVGNRDVWQHLYDRHSISMVRKALAYCSEWKATHEDEYGRQFRILCEAEDDRTGEMMTVYEAKYGGRYVCTSEYFRGKASDGKRRFEPLSKS